MVHGADANVPIRGLEKQQMPDNQNCSLDSGHSIRDHTHLHFTEHVARESLVKNRLDPIVRLFVFLFVH